MSLREVLIFLRAHFLPVIIAPVMLGAAISFYLYHSLDGWKLAFALLGSSFLHLAANGIDDIFDFVNSVDILSERMIRSKMAYKPIVRGTLSVSNALLLTISFYALSLVIAVYLAFLTGLVVILFAFLGIAISLLYVVPPVKLDYRGFGETLIFLCFGPVPVTGTFYVLTGSLSYLPFLLSIPTGIFTTNILLMHDTIFYKSYLEGGKLTLATRLGEEKTRVAVAILGSIAYIILIIIAVAGFASPFSLISFLSLPVFLISLRVEKEKGTFLSFLTSILFTSLFAFSLFL